MKAKTKVIKDNKDIIYMAALAVAACILAFMLIHRGMVIKASDSYVRQRVFQLRGEKGACTGVQVKAPSGMVYMLTAGHCMAILGADHSAMSTDEDGTQKRVFMMDIDEDMDLMLMSPATTASIDIARNVHYHESIHTLTHGLTMPTYRTDGEVLQEQDVDVAYKSITTLEQLMACERPALTGEGVVCVKTLSEQMTSAQVYPGSSGGPVLDASGDLVGIVSIGSTNTIFSGMVPLHLIHDFIRAR